MKSPLVSNGPVISVAMSVLNGGKHLELAVRSIIEQTFGEWELLIIDDGSTDGAVENLPYLDDPRIIVIRDGLNKGLSSRLNQAINMARGQYFARMDHDDISHPNRFEQQIAFLEAHTNVDLLATKCVTMNEVDQIIGLLPHASDHERICARPWLGFPMPHPSWMGKIVWFRQHYYQDPGPFCCEDSELLLRAHKCSVYHALEADLLAYRVRIHIPWQKMWKTRKAMAAVQIKYFVENRDWFSAILSCVVTFARVMRDMGRAAFQYFLIGHRLTVLVDGSKRRAWSELIAKLTQ